MVPLTLPVASEAKPDNPASEKSRFVVDLTADGVIRLGGKATNLFDLTAELTRQKLLHAYARKMQGLEPFRRIGGRNISHLGVLMRAHKDAPSRHVGWILMTLMDSGFYDVEFGVKRRADRSYAKKEAASLGAEWRDVPAPASPRVEASLAHRIEHYSVIYPLGTNPKVQSMSQILVEITPLEEREIAWGAAGMLVKVPVRVRYAIEAIDDPDSMETPAPAVVTSDLQALGRLIQEGKRKLGKDLVVGVVRPRPRIPFKYVIAVLNQFLKRGISRHRLAWRGKPPSYELVKKRELPYPDRGG
ncbi:MAG: hypothetical protein ACE5JG_04165 [Planctomycetota bacterium]